ncbi:CHASE2 domain-containing protein [Deinococcus radiophilus]|uniref:CHASE2 domain-containing protein n=1 Tax=Deinococcus radiophilus TaxID=32062 RepID=UPI00226E5F57|nr:CHASE2 domain-containing protein [Deinococcus radiophilus]UFA51218.1 CHASE2 domain-containing protein [Deinococcus radiophilus]
MDSAVWSGRTTRWLGTSLRPRQPRSAPQAFLVSVDPVAVAEYGPVESWSPEIFRRALTQLDQAGVRAVGLDLPQVGGDVQEAAAEVWGGRLVLATRSQDPALLPGVPAAVRAAVSRGLSTVNPGEANLYYAFQTGYGAENGPLLPSFAWQLARLAGSQKPLNAAPRFLYHFSPSALQGQLNFSDVLRGNFDWAAVQGRVAVIGASSVDPDLPSSSVLQVRAVSSLLAPENVMFSRPVVALLAALTAALSLVLGGYWGFVLALLMPLLLVRLWPLGIVFPGITLAFTALLGTGLVALEYLLSQRGMRLRQTYSEQVLGSRVALTRTLEGLTLPGGHPAPAEPLDGARDETYLFLVKLRGYRQLQQQFGQEWAEEAVDQAVLRLRDLQPSAYHLEGVGFRWEADELAFLITSVAGSEEAQAIAQQLVITAAEVVLRGVALKPQVGLSRIVRPQLAGESSVAALIEQTRRNQVASADTGKA